MTDLEAHVAREGRDDEIKQVRAKIDELGITYIYYQFVSVTGRIVGKGIVCDPAQRFELAFATEQVAAKVAFEIFQKAIGRWANRVPT